MNVGPVEAINGGSGVTAAAPVALKPELAHQAGAGGADVIDMQSVKRMVAEIHEQMRSMDVSLEFAPYGEHGEKIAIIIANKETGEVIREIPSREIRNLYEKIGELAGLIFDRRA